MASRKILALCIVNASLMHWACSDEIRRTSPSTVNHSQAAPAVASLPPSSETNANAEAKPERGASASMLPVDEENSDLLPAPVKVGGEDIVKVPDGESTDSTTPIETPVLRTTADFNECNVFVNTPIKASVYQTSENDFFSKYNSKILRNFDYSTPLKSICLPNLNIAQRRFTEGFPGYPDLKSWFVLDVHFLLDAPTAGRYKLSVRSDDGSLLSVNGVEVIDIDSIRHSNVAGEAEVDLKANGNVIRLKYFQGPPMEIALMLKWVRPGSTVEEYIPSEFIRPSP